MCEYSDQMGKSSTRVNDRRKAHSNSRPCKKVRTTTYEPIYMSWHYCYFVCSFSSALICSGVHNLCFDNRMSTISGKGISFNLYVGDALHKHDAASQKNLSPLENSVLKTSEGMMGIKDQVRGTKRHG